MSLDDELSSAGAALRAASESDVTAADIRHRSRRGRLLLGVAMIAATVGTAVAITAGEGEDVSVDVVDRNPSPDDDDGAAELGAGHGPSQIVDADGVVVATIDDAPGAGSAISDLVVGELTESGNVAPLRHVGGSNDRVALTAQLADAGLVIESTIRSPEQEAALDAIAAAGVPAGPSTALLSVDPSSGAITAAWGPITVSRFVGGLYQPAVMVAALEAGVPDDELFPNPATLTVGTGDQAWSVNNDDGSSSEPVTMAEALALGSNVVWAGLVGEGRVTPDDMVAAGQQLGFPPDAPAVSALALGTVETTPTEVATVFATFATGGLRPDPHVVNRVLGPNGEVIYERGPAQDPVRAADGATIAVVRRAMQQVICCGTGTNARLDSTAPAFGKPGTSGDWLDAWFAGSTPSRTTVVWIGFPDEPVSMRPPTTSATVTGGGHPAQVWKHFTDAIAELVPEPAEFPE